MQTFPIGQAAQLLGVSPDTVRRWIDAGRLQASKTTGGHRLIDGTELAAFARELAESPDASGVGRASARNRFVGLVTDVVKDEVMAKVEMICGSHRVVSLISREAVDELGLTPGVMAVALVKATNVIVELPRS